MFDLIPALASSSIHVGDFDVSGSYTAIALIAASTNALNGALIARRPDHYKNWTVVGIIGMALLMGLGAGITREVRANQVPSALTNDPKLKVAARSNRVG